jgi:UDP-glucose:(heptosyl)LPS alpha-1,3-glucosyltransferase
MTQEVVFVAGDVGGLGGMEHQSEQLIRRLLEAGSRVTVIARTCDLPQHERLEFVRVPTPRRPFAVAYPAFIAVASILAARRRGGLLHTTGAIVATRADLSTVHYCHRAARRRLSGSRAARPNAAYRLNALLAGTMSRAAEAWCYRPERATLLCAVSGGMASELEREFPRMRGAIRSVPNGVDVDRFRPDPGARERIRAELGITQDEPVALFTGGDWERKGLSHAVEALDAAGDWRLLVAGPGDPRPVVTAARTAGTEQRLRFLGPVHDMPSLYAAADAFVLPTAYETFSLVSYEAAACGLPLLVTRVNGVEDLIEDGVNGWFIDPDRDDIARRLGELRAAPELAASMGAAARASALNHSWEAMAERYLSLYAELALRHNRAA